MSGTRDRKSTFLQIPPSLAPSEFLAWGAPHETRSPVEELYPPRRLDQDALPGILAQRPAVSRSTYDAPWETISQGASSSGDGHDTRWTDVEDGEDDEATLKKTETASSVDEDPYQASMADPLPIWQWIPYQVGYSVRLSSRGT